MKFRTAAASLALAASALPFAANAANEAVTDVAVAMPAPTARVTLAANTPVALTLNSALTTKANHTGDRFSMTVAQDVYSGDQIVIPKGTRAVGLVTFATGNGSFGKSGKMELAFKYLELGGQQIPIEGTYFQEGSGNTAGTVGAMVAAGVIGGLVVKGKSAEVVQGKDFSATIMHDVPFASANGSLVIDPSFRPAAVSMATETAKERKARLKAEARANKG